MSDMDLSDSAGDRSVDGQSQRDSPRPREMLASTTPRRRVVLDWDPVLKQISSQVVLRNRSQEWFAFKYETDCPLIVATPERGVLMPGEQINLSLLLDEDCDAKREFDHDCCELVISPFHIDHLMNSDRDIEDFVRTAFPDDTPLEKHVLLPAISNMAKERLDIVVAEKEAKNQHDEELQNLKNIVYPAICVLMSLLTLYIFMSEFCLPLSLPPERHAQRRL